MCEPDQEEEIALATPDTFPVEAIKDAFFETLDEGKVLVLSAPTGSGKSTRVPLWFAARKRRVLVVEPRRVACRSLAHFLKTQTDSELVAHRIRFESTQQASTRILFVTPGMALNMLAQNDPFLDEECAIVLDEFHERSAQADLFLALAIKRHQRETFPLVLASATLDAEHLGNALDANFLQAQGRMFDIDLFHDKSPAAPSRENLAERVMQKVLDAKDKHAGDILVFLPGKGEITRCASALAHRSELQCAPVHGGIHPQTLQKLFEGKDSNKTVVYLATNVAETSLTLPGVRVVIDSGLVRMRLHRAGQSTLTLIPAALSSMTQRMGRAGRVASGTCYRLFSQTFKARAQTPPEILRIELDELMLDALQMGLSPRAIRALPFVDPPPPFAFDRAFAKLKKIGALDDEGVTKLGKELGGSPVDATHALLIRQAPPPLRFAMCALVTVLQERASYERPMPSDDELAARECRAALDPTRAQMHALLFGDAQAEKLDKKRLQNAKQVLDALCRFFECPRPEGFALPSADTLSSVIAQALPQSAFALRTRAQRSKKEVAQSLPYGNGEVEVMVDVSAYEKGAPYEKEKLPAPSTLLVLTHTWLTDSRGQVRGRSRLSLPVQASTLVEAGACETSFAEPRWEGGKVVADQTHTLGGRVLSCSPRKLSGEDLCAAATSLVLEGRLRRVFPELKQRLEEAFHLAVLYGRFGLEISEDAGQLQEQGMHDFLRGRFALVGLEHSEDFALLSADDLVPQVMPASVLPSRYDDVREAFPREIHVAGADYDVQVFPAAKKVELHPRNKKAKAHVLKRVELPRFLGFRVERVQASRRVSVR